MWELELLIDGVLGGDLDWLLPVGGHSDWDLLDDGSDHWNGLVDDTGDWDDALVVPLDLVGDQVLDWLTDLDITILLLDAASLASTSGLAGLSLERVSTELGRDGANLHVWALAAGDAGLGQVVVGAQDLTGWLTDAVGELGSADGAGSTAAAQGDLLASSELTCADSDDLT